MSDTPISDSFNTCASCRFWSKTSLSFNEKQAGYCREEGFSELLTYHSTYCSSYGPRIVGGEEEVIEDDE